MARSKNDILQGTLALLVLKTLDAQGPMHGYAITAHIGVVRGITVRSRSVIGNLGGALQSVFGGNLSIYTELAERAQPLRKSGYGEYLLGLLGGELAGQ